MRFHRPVLPPASPPPVTPSRVFSASVVSVTAALAVILVTTALTATVTARAAVPPAPGWNLVWSDDFTGAANTLPSSANWIIDTGTSYPGGPANWGTGEIQTYTASTANIRHDGAGNLQIIPLGR